MNTRTNSLLSALLGGATLIAFTPFARAEPWSNSDRHGTIVVAQKVVRAIAPGPALLHVYSATSGGTIFVAPFATGGDADCSGSALDAPSQATPLAAEQVLVLNVGPGKVACLATTADRSFELLWHAL
jgi:hypothetical protein